MDHENEPDQIIIVAKPPTKIQTSAYKGIRMGGYSVVGNILAAMLCAKFAIACNAAGGNEVIAGSIAGGLYTAWDIVKTKVFKLDP